MCNVMVRPRFDYYVIDIDWTFDLAVVTLTYKILSGLFLRSRKL